MPARLTPLLLLTCASTLAAAPPKVPESYIRIQPSSPAEPAPQAPAQGFQVQGLANRVHLLSSPGGNVGLVVTRRHALLVDASLARLGPQLLEAVRSVTDKPIKYVIHTHHHEDHTGASLTLDGQGAILVAHTNGRQRMLLAQEGLEMTQRGGLPELAVGQPGARGPALLALHVDGVELQVYHPGVGHTDGDLTVSVPSSMVIFLGDLFFHGTVPYIDLDAGGSLGAMLQRIEEFCSWIPDNARIVPGHGPLATKRDLLRYRDFLKEVQAHVAKRPEKSGADMLRAFDRRKWSDIRDLGPELTWEKFMDLAAGRRPAN